MRNRLLSITRRMIPYLPELNPITGSIAGSILMQQLDYWFERYPDGFYKFLEPASHERYKPKESWTEETGMTRSEFRTAFDSIGYRHTSKAAFLNAPDKFMGRMYASYVDRRANLTYYFRNHSLVDQRLDEMVSNQDSQPIDFKADPNPPVSPPHSPVSPPHSPVSHPHSPVSHPNPENRAALLAGQGIANTDVGATVYAHQGIGSTALPTTETTTETTSEKNQLLQPASAKATETPQSSSGNSDKSKRLHYPNLPGSELKAIEKALEFCPDSHHQDLLDEIEGIRLGGGFTRGAIPLARGLIKKIGSGEFSLSAGVGVRARREQRLANEAAVQAAATPRPIAPSNGRPTSPLPKRLAELTQKFESFAAGNGANHPEEAESN